MQTFFERNADRLQAFARVSQTIGARADYVQGGGGNTSVKLADNQMAIKASGYCLKEVKPDNAYAVLDFAAIRNFYHGHTRTDFADVEQAGAAQTKAATVEVAGLKPLRPSVEAGFHSLLGTFVVHSHSVYANLATCTDACYDIARRAFAGAQYAWACVAYTDPGASLTFSILDALRQTQRDEGREPAVILMRNHGIIVHDNDPDVCLMIHQDANRRLAAAFSLADDAFGDISVRALAGGITMADTPMLRNALRQCPISYETLMQQPLYPDQMVFLNGVFFQDKPCISAGECVADTTTGEMLLYMDSKKAQAVTETVAAVLFVVHHIRAAGYEISTMGEAARAFVENWESEKYRKSIATKA